MMARNLSPSRRAVLAVAAASPLSGLSAAPARAAAPQDGSDARIDGLVQDFMREFEVPGVGVAIVRPATAPWLRGYGVRRLGEAAPVDARTLFAIASNSKAFLAACFALLVDEGRLGWDDPVVRHLPEFQMQDPAVTAMMTVRDLLVHRSGLPLGAGDLMQFPTSDRTAEDILKALPHFKAARGFRAGYAYDNTLYIVGGILLRRVSGQSWEDFVSSRIFRPLGMTGAVALPTLVKDPNRAGRHARLGPPARGLGKVEVVPPRESAVVGPAGGINASLADIVAWLQVQLAGGALPDGRRLWSAAQSAEMWTPQTIVASGPGPGADHPERSVISGYALGWGVADYRGQRMLSHSGGLSGQITRTTLLPERGVGFVVFSNSEESEAVSGLRYAIMDELLQAPPHPWLAWARQAVDRRTAELAKVAGSGDFIPPFGGPSLPLAAYAGRYRDAWYGDVVVRHAGGPLSIDFTHTPAFKSALEPFGPDAFRTRFARGAGEDAVVTFQVGGGAVTRVSMKALSPLADFSFDFHDLDLMPVAG